jgi:K+-transporting ATPase ATPase C chain
MVRACLVLFVAFTVLLGVVYPVAITALAQLAFPDEANGSLLEREGVVIGSSLVGQSFDDPAYFWGRPSATAKPYDASASAGSNLGPLNPALAGAVAARIAALRAADPTSGDALVPIDLVTASGSGLDPHISPAAAYYQVPRVAHARAVAEAEVRAVVDARIQRPLLGEAVVNVLQLNLALDEQATRMAGS